MVSLGLTSDMMTRDQYNCSHSELSSTGTLIKDGRCFHLGTRFGNREIDEANKSSGNGNGNE